MKLRGKTIRSGKNRAHPPDNRTRCPHISVEPERYELTAAAPYRFDLDRREFFKFLGAGVLVVSVLKPALSRRNRAERASAAEILCPRNRCVAAHRRRRQRHGLYRQRSRWGRTSAPR